MIFIGGITGKTKQLLYDSAVMVCSRCGRYGRYQVYMTYMCLSLFFIPVFSWGKRYYVTMSCCGTTYQLSPEKGKRIARGEHAEILPEDLTLETDGNGAGYGERHCPSCGFRTAEAYEYCPKCGQRLVS